MIDYKKIFRNKELRLKLISCLGFIPSKPYLKMVYWIKTGEKIDLEHPVTFCDKLNWLKLHDLHPEYTELVDKLTVRNYVNRIAGEDICFPLLGQWEHYDDIDFAALPDRFVLKCNHDSGSVKVVMDKSRIDHTEFKKFFEGRLRMNPYLLGREYPYKNVKPRILAEKYMTPEGEKDIFDYKFFCFGGKPELLFVATDRSSGDCRFDFYDMDFQHLDITNIHPQSGHTLEKPENFEQMKELAAKLSSGMKFVRLDLYSIQGRIYFGEYTFFHGGGFWPVKPGAWERKLGDLIQL